MKLISVCVGVPREVSWKGKPVMTGIFKQPVEGRVVMRSLNLEGDQQADLTVHGVRHRSWQLSTTSPETFARKCLQTAISLKNQPSDDFGETTGRPKLMGGGQRSMSKL
ncbi:hypothetical protein [Stenomitos frigidus]|uniref:hypothetical protein n=1 Tax=Stenomitos frigidus TaxID=1886765 RepID=UPI001C6371C0|nr:hypothetical protein [Stenomitos frigidus]